MKNSITKSLMSFALVLGATQAYAKKSCIEDYNKSLDKLNSHFKKYEDKDFSRDFMVGYGFFVYAAIIGAPVPMAGAIGLAAPIAKLKNNSDYKKLQKLNLLVPLFDKNKVEHNAAREAFYTAIRSDIQISSDEYNQELDKLAPEICTYFKKKYKRTINGKVTITTYQTTKYPVAEHIIQYLEGKGYTQLDKSAIDLCGIKSLESKAKIAKFNSLRIGRLWAQINFQLERLAKDKGAFVRPADIQSLKELRSGLEEIDKNEDPYLVSVILRSGSRQLLDDIQVQIKNKGSYKDKWIEGDVVKIKEAFSDTNISNVSYWLGNSCR